MNQLCDDYINEHIENIEDFERSFYRDVNEDEDSCVIHYDFNDNSFDASFNVCQIME